ncbi:helix-turn-helix transcriptional regulator [Streptomyces racemochromogenes]|uniref:Helix-turn-helix transcriptional regulator n=1 Tax=Streptomyces racemochromogenes TaxID=67353 RepID=A0ABW7PE91_9ACTN
MPAVPAPGRRSCVSHDAGTVRAFLEDAYGSRVELTVLTPAPEPYRITHTDAGDLAGGDLVLPGRLGFVSGPPRWLVVATVRAGRLTLRDGRDEYPLTAGQTFLDGRFGHSLTTRTEDLELRTVAIPWDAVRTAARRAVPGDDRPVRFTGLLPCDAAHATVWQRTADFAHRTLLAPDLPASPQVLVESARLLAATALAVFPNTVLGAHSQGPPPAECRDTASDTLRRAVAFIEGNAAADIGLADIAAAVPVTPRALQYAFARHADTTPLGYLRRVRLTRVHDELRAAAPDDGLSVSRIAARWGFAHAGRFAATYREAYGRSPSQTFRARE